VISLGTTSQDGNMRQVKVEVLGVMDPESKLIRLRAVEPLQVIPSQLISEVMNEPCVVLPDLSLFKDFVVTYDYDMGAIRFYPHLIHRDCYITRLCTKEHTMLLHSNW